MAATLLVIERSRTHLPVRSVLSLIGMSPTPKGEKTPPTLKLLGLEGFPLRLFCCQTLDFGRDHVDRGWFPERVSVESMTMILKPWQMAVVALAGWLNEQQRQIIEFQNDQTEVLLKQLGRKRILLSDDQRRILAVKGKALGRTTLRELTTIVTPDTILRWHRELVCQEWDHSDKRKSIGRPRIRQVIVDLILRFARENPTWGYDRIQGALANVGYRISDRTVGNVLKANDLEPASDRQRTGEWSTFLKAHWDVLAAIDFTTIEVWTKGGLLTYYLLFVMELKTRRVHFAGCTPHPDGQWMRQIARNLTDAEDGFLLEK